MNSISIMGLMTTVKMLVTNFNNYSREFTTTGNEYSLGAKGATLAAISFLCDDLDLVIEFGTEYAENGFGYTIIKLAEKVNAE